MRDLVLIPGLVSDAAIWSRTIAALGPGANCSVGNTLVDDTIEGMARRILADASATFTLAGVSMGGMVAMEIMRVAPDRVRALALVGTSARPATEDDKKQRLATNAAIASAGSARTSSNGNVDYLVHSSAAADVREEISSMGARVGPDVYIRQNLAIMNRPDLRPALATISVPCAVVVGASDRVNPPELSAEIHEAVHGSRFYVVPDCGHLPPIETPETMAGILANLATIII